MRSSGLIRANRCNSVVTLDGLAFFTNVLVLGATAMLFLTSYRFLELSREHKGEYYGLALLAQAGMYFMATGSDLITLFSASSSQPPASTFWWDLPAPIAGRMKPL